MKLDWLALYGTRSVATLEGIERLGNLKALRVFEFARLTSLEPLTRLPASSALEVSWCYKVANYDVLLRVPRLRQVEFYFCNMKLVAAIRPALEAQGVQFTQAVKRRAEEL
jgi:hypothetical protein